MYAIILILIFSFITYSAVQAQEEPTCALSCDQGTKLEGSTCVVDLDEVCQVGTEPSEGVCIDDVEVVSECASFFIAHSAAQAQEEPTCALSCGQGTKLEGSTCVVDLDEVCQFGTKPSEGVCIDDKLVEVKSKCVGDCLIATASFGSGLAPQVQMLREVRDNIVLSTYFGSLFMDSFNTIYYSFSPVVAQIEYENPTFRNAVKALITPMITVLSIMTLAEENSEIQVVMFGALTISVIVGMYVIVPVFVIKKIRHRLSK